MPDPTEAVNMVAICKGRSDSRSEMLAIMRAFVEETVKEDGCLEYRLHNSVDDPDVFVFFETWRDQTAVDRHFARPEIRELIAKLEHVLASPADMYRMCALT